jgi:hypothetical protein
MNDTVIAVLVGIIAGSAVLALITEAEDTDWHDYTRPDGTICVVRDAPYSDDQLLCEVAS